MIKEFFSIPLRWNLKQYLLSKNLSTFNETLIKNQLEINKDSKFKVLLTHSALNELVIKIDIRNINKKITYF